MADAARDGWRIKRWFGHMRSALIRPVNQASVEAGRAVTTDPQPLPSPGLRTLTVIKPLIPPSTHQPTGGSPYQPTGGRLEAQEVYQEVRWRAGSEF